MSEGGRALTVAGLVKLASRKLELVSDTSRLDAEVLMCRVLRTSTAGLLARCRDIPEPEMVRKFWQHIGRRLTGEPVAYITGEREFWSMSLLVTTDTLIPRPETERLVELALERIPARADWTLVDLGTGTGAIALAIARERPQCRLIATDHSAAALAVAKQNAQRHDVENIHFVHADWLDFEHHCQYPMILSNPPYIRAGDPHLGRGDVRFEPERALVSGEDGLDDIRRIARQSLACLATGGYLLLECGCDQGSAVADCMLGLGYDHGVIKKDLGARDRVVIARKPDVCQV